jgi:hypothetical protein
MQFALPSIQDLITLIQALQANREGGLLLLLFVIVTLVGWYAVVRHGKTPDKKQR